MLSLPTPRPPVSRRMRARLRDERGFTLIELLVAMMSGLVVLGALFAILEVSLHQNTRSSDIVEATQLGRVTMTKMVDKLHSACLASKFNPVLEGSTGNTMLLVNAASEKSEPSLSEIHEDKFQWTEEKEGRGVLKDYTYVATAGPNNEGNYTFASSPEHTAVIGEHIKPEAKAENLKTKAKETTLFAYYAYAATASTSTTAASSALGSPFVEASPGLSGAQANEVAGVEIGFNEAPAQDWKHETSVSNTSLVTLAFSAPSSESTIKAGPCE